MITSEFSLCSSSSTK